MTIFIWNGQLNPLFFLTRTVMRFYKKNGVGITPNQPLLQIIFSLLEDFLSAPNKFHRSTEWKPNGLLLHLPSGLLDSVSIPNLPLHQLPYSAHTKYDKKDAKISSTSQISIFVRLCWVADHWTGHLRIESLSRFPSLRRLECLWFLSPMQFGKLLMGLVFMRGCWF